MNVISATNKDLLTPNSSRNRMMMSRQIRVVDELYKTFPFILVGGGMPYNAAFKVGARDIDIFCVDIGTALAVKQYLRGDEISAALGYKAEHFVFDGKQENEYAASFNSDCLKFMGCPPGQRGVAFEFNVIVRKVPVGVELMHRAQLVPLYVMTVPYEPYGICYVDKGPDLFALRPRGSTGCSVFDPTSTGDLFRKIQTKYLMFVASTGRNGTINGLSTRFEPSHAKAPLFPPVELAGRLFHSTTRLIRDSYSYAISVNRTSGLFKTLESIGWMYADYPDHIALNEDLTTEQKDSAFIEEACSCLTKPTLDSCRYSSGQFSLSHLRAQYNAKFSGSSGSRSQDWVNTWGLAQTVQPSGGEDSELPPTTPEWHRATTIRGYHHVPPATPEQVAIRDAFNQRIAEFAAAQAAQVRAATATTTSPSFARVIDSLRVNF